MEVGQSTLLQLLDKFVVDDFEFDLFCLFLPLNLKSSGSVKNPIISVVISNYPLANGGYLVSFSQEGPDGSFKSYDPVYSLDFEASKLAPYLEFSSIFLPKGCYYLSDMELAGFIKVLSYGALCFEMKLLPASSQMQSLILVKVDEKSLSNLSKCDHDGPKEED